MSNFTYAQALSEIKSYAKNLGLTFKCQNATINGKQAYMLTDRKTGLVVAKNFTLWSAYEDMQRGYFDKVANS